MAYAVLVLVIVLDQLTKYLYDTAGRPSVPLIPGILALTYVENKGAAWGLFNNHQIILYIFSAVITVAVGVFFVWKYKKLKIVMRIALALIIAGAIGNLIDRFALSYVRDMIQFTFIDFPVFNVADSAITIGGALMLIDVLFFENGDKKGTNEAQAGSGQQNDASDTEDKNSAKRTENQ